MMVMDRRERDDEDDNLPEFAHGLDGSVDCKLYVSSA